MKKILLFFLFFLMISLKAQISFQAVPEKEEMELDEPVRIQFTLSIKNKSSKSINVSEIILPVFKNAKVISQQKIIQNSEIEGVEVGVISYQVTLQAIKKGSLKIDPAKAVVDGKTYETKLITIKVKSNSIDQEEKTYFPVEDAFIVFKVQDKTPYQNEGVLARLKFYTRRIDFFNSPFKFESPSFQGLYVEMVKNYNNTYEQEVINGEVYLSKVIGYYLLFPAKSGTITVNPFKITLSVPDGLFFDQEIVLKSQAVNLQVKKILNPPQDFYGLVGDYDVKVSSNKKNAKLNEAVNISISVSGTGNMEMLKVPDLIIPEGIEKFPSKENLKSRPTLKGVVGEMTVSTVIVPRKEGNYNISMKPISYFDPKTNSFKKLTIEPLSLQVVSPPEKEKTKMDKHNGVKVPDKKIVKDSSSIVESYIPNIDKTISYTEGKEKKSKLLIYSVIGFCCVALIVLMLVFFIIKKKKNKTIDGNIIEEKTKFEKLSTKTNNNKLDFSAELFRLKNLAESGEKKEFYTLLESTLNLAVNQNLTASKYQIFDDIDEKLTNKFGDEFAEEYKKLILKAQIERYSNLSDDDSLYSVYLKAEEIIKKLKP